MSIKISPEVEIALNAAASDAQYRGNEYITLEHLLFSILHDDGAKVIISQCGADPKRITEKLDQFISNHFMKLDKKQPVIPEPTIALQRTLQRAALHLESSGRKREVLLCDVLVALYEEPESHAVYFLKKEGVNKFDVVSYISHGITEGGNEQIYPSSPEEKIDEEKNEGEKEGPLASFTVDLIKKAQSGLIDPVIGRENELKRTVQTLCRRRKNNPLYVGDPGVGKTAVAEGLALKIFEGKVPHILKDAKIYSLDMGTLLAGTRYRGDFEKRLKSVLAALQKNKNTILFIDEIHTIVGGGAVSGGSMDASNILKPSLASGELKCIGSTTYREYRNSFEKDRALARRFQKIEIDEPDSEKTFKILLGIKKHYEKFHNIQFSKPALKAAIDLSIKYIHDRKLPDKAIDVIDEVGASFRISPQKEKRTVVRIKDIETAVAYIAKIPSKNITNDDKHLLAHLEKRLKEKIFGQDKALAIMTNAIKLSRAGLSHPDKPIGSFLFTGPTGVGKTEAARQLSKIMGIKFLRFDMSEYSERHTVSRLIGAPPGYVGFDQGGILTDSVNQNNYAVLLLDEIEKAHPDLFNILLQVMDHATLTDNNGKKANFRNIILIMTSNVGSSDISKETIGFTHNEKEVSGLYDKAVQKLFSPEFRNRLDSIIPFNQLNIATMEQVVEKFINELKEQLSQRQVSINLSQEAKQWLAKKGYSITYGARPLTRLIHTEIKEKIAHEILFGKLVKGGTVKISLNNDQLIFSFL